MHVNGYYFYFIILKILRSDYFLLMDHFDIWIECIYSSLIELNCDGSTIFKLSDVEPLAVLIFNETISCDLSSFPENLLKKLYSLCDVCIFLCYLFLEYDFMVEYR